MGSIAIDLRATDHTGSAIEGATSHLRALQSEAERGPGIFGRLTSGLGGLTSGLGGVLQVASGVLGAGLFTGLASQAHDFFAGAIQESRDAAHGMAQTEAAIKSTGGAAGMTAQQIADMAGSLSHTTLFSDDAIQAGENMSLTFTNIGKDVFPQVTSTVLDMAQALHSTPEAIAQMTGKALSSAQGVTALQRVGVTFTEQQKEMVTHLFATGHAADAQRIELAELNREFGGSGAAAMQADGGYHQFQQTLADTEQTVGDALRPALTQLMGLMGGPVLGAVQTLAVAFAGALPGAIAWLTDTALPALASGWQTLQGALQRVTQFLTPIIAGFVDFQVSISPLFTIISGLTSSWSDMVATWQETGSIAEVVDVFIEAIDGMGPAGDIISTFLAIGRDLVPVVGAIGSALWNGDTAGAVTAFQQGMAGIGEQVGFLATELGDWLVGIASTIATNVMTWGSAFVGWLGPHIPGILAALGGLATSIGSWIVEQGTLWASQLLNWGQGFVDWIAPYVGPALQALGSFGVSIGTWILEQGSAWGAQLLQWGEQFLTWVAPLVPPLLAELGSIAVSIGSWILQQGTAWGAQLLAWGQQFLAWITPLIPPLLAELGSIALSIGSWILEQGAVLGTQLLAWGQGFIAWIAPMIPPALAALGGLIASIGGWVVAQVPVIAAQLAAWGQSFIAWVQPMIPPALAALGGLASGLLGWIGQQAAPILASLGAWATSFVAWIGPATVKFLGEWPGMLSQFLDWIGSAAGPLLLKLGEWALQFVAWIAPMIPGFIVALGGVALALTTFVAETAVVLLGKLGEWGKAFGSWISTDAIPALKAAWPGFWESLKGLMDTANTAATAKMNEIGHSIVDGMKAGIAAAWSTFTGWIHGKIMEIPEAVRKVLGIHSPSTVMAELVGVPIVQGIAMGIQAGAATMTATVTAAVGNAIDAARAVVTGAKFPSPLDAMTGIRQATNSSADAIRSLLKTGDFKGGILGMQEDDPFIGFLLKARTDATATKNILDVLNTGDFRGGILGLQEDDPSIAALLKASAATTQLTTGMTDLTPRLPSLTSGLAQIAQAADTATKAFRSLDDRAAGMFQGGKGLDDKLGFGGGGDPFSFLKPAGGLGASADYAKQAGQGAGMTFGTGWQQGIEQIRPQIQDTTRLTFQQLQDVVLLPWQDNTRTFFSGAGFGFIGAASEGMNSAGNGLAQSAGNVGGAAGAALVGGLRGNLGGIGQAVSDINSELSKIKTEIIIHITTVRDGATTTGAGLPQLAGHRALGGPVTAGMPYIVGEHRPELFVPQTNGYILPSVPSAGTAGTSRAPQQPLINELHVHVAPGQDASAFAEELWPILEDKWDASQRLRGLR